MFVGVLCIAASIGRCSAGEQVPEVRTVRIPEVHTKVEYRDRYQPMPEHCVTAYNLIVQATAESGDMSHSAGQILDALTDLGTGKAVGDVKEVNDAITRVRAAQDTLDNAVLTSAERKIALDSAISSCRKEVAASP